MIKRKQQGFTIIEVVLVLAIAGLIFLMVFIALPALRRSQRDTGRKSDVSIVASALNTYLSNNKGSFNQLSTGTLTPYIDSLSQYDVDGGVLVPNIIDSGIITASVDTIQIAAGRKCGTINGAAVTLTTTGASARNAVLVTGLENNGSTMIAYCQDF